MMHILRALGHRKLGALLIVLQIALTLGIMVNALSILQTRLAYMRRPSGLPEADIFTMSNLFTGPDTELSIRIRGDLAALRSIPGVVDAAAVQSFPLRGYGHSVPVARLPGQQQRSTVNAAIYYTTPEAMRTLGSRLLVGREFESDEVHELHFGRDRAAPAVAIVTRALARRLFPDGDALGRSLYLGTSMPVRVIGIVERAESPWAAQRAARGAFGSELSIFVPYQYVGPLMAYVVRTQPGRCAALVPIAERRLYATSRARVISEAQTFAETRAQQYRSDRSLGLIMAVVCTALMAVTAMGIVALTSSWVAQRRRQIGLRRALGARRLEILRYFHLENLLICTAGVALGAALATGGNLLLAARFAMTQLSPLDILLAAAVVVALGQLAVLWPALRAASVPPGVAARGT